MCPVMSWEHNGSIFDAALVGKWLHIWNVCSAICSTKMSVSWWVLVRFWVFKNPYESSCVLPCPEHVLPCPGHVLGIFKSCTYNYFGKYLLGTHNLFTLGLSQLALKKREGAKIKELASMYLLTTLKFGTRGIYVKTIVIKCFRTYCFLGRRKDLKSGGDS